MEYGCFPAAVFFILHFEPRLMPLFGWRRRSSALDNRDRRG